MYRYKVNLLLNRHKKKKSFNTTKLKILVLLSTRNQTQHDFSCNDKNSNLFRHYSHCLSISKKYYDLK